MEAEAVELKQCRHRLIHPLKLVVFELCLWLILDPLQAIGVHPCLHRMMYNNFLLPFTNRLWNLARVAKVRPEEISHTRMGEKERG